ncbi:MAG: non-canonical purine NTP pyrophosphatase, partial [Verrucomicrobia bacterium]
MTANLGAMDLLLATRNQHKTREFAQLLGPNFTLRDLTSEHDLPEILETGRTFEENAVIKAIAISKIFPDQVVIGDDSGLEVK